ncbi:MAG: CBS domain-containing protein [Burkholderiales bacterium]|jgi:Mg2+/Co2+ transporter CorB|nr:CBS domain-containing protein [Burkholderiales bacterium]
MTTFLWLLIAGTGGIASGFLIAVVFLRHHRSFSQNSTQTAFSPSSEATTDPLPEIPPHLQELLSGSVDDVMTPRPQIQALDLMDSPTRLRQSIAAGHCLRLPVYEDSLDHLVGVLDLRDVLRLFSAKTFDADALRALLHPAYYIPAGTPLLKQVQQFQADRQRLGFVVDEYGELQGQVTLEDLVHEIATVLASRRSGLSETSPVAPAIPEAGIVIDAGTSLRTLNRRLGCHFPLDGPKTLSGLIVEHLGDIPEAGARCEIAGYLVEILQTKQHAIRVVKLRPDPKTLRKNAALPLQTPEEQASS